MVADDFGESYVGGGDLRGLRQQLPGMTDGAERVADLMGDAGGEPTQRRELHLLRLLRQRGGILQKDQRTGARALTQLREARQQFGSAGGGTYQLRLAVGLLLALVEVVSERGRARMR